MFMWPMRRHLPRCHLRADEMFFRVLCLKPDGRRPWAVLTIVLASLPIVRPSHLNWCMYGYYPRYNRYKRYKRTFSSQAKHGFRHRYSIFKNRFKPERKSFNPSPQYNYYPRASRSQKSHSFQRGYKAYKPYTHYRGVGDRGGKEIGKYIASKFDIYRPYHRNPDFRIRYSNASNSGRYWRHKAAGILSDFTTGEVSDYIRRTPEESARVRGQTWSEWGREKFSNLGDTVLHGVSSATATAGTLGALGYSGLLLNE